MIEKQFTSRSDSVCFSAVLAATSPRKSVKANWKLAKQAFADIKKGHTGKILLFNYALPCHRNNLQRIYEKYSAGGFLYMDPAQCDFELSGPKVNAFFHNLIGDLNYVTIDVWMVRFYGLSEKTAVNTPKKYKAIAERVKRSARRYGLYPAELQAILWSAERFRAGFKPSTYLVASYDDAQLVFNFMK